MPPVAKMEKADAISKGVTLAAPMAVGRECGIL